LRVSFITIFFLNVFIPVTLLMNFNAEASEASFGSVRVAVATQADTLGLRVSGNYQLIDQSNKITLCNLNQDENWKIELQGGHILLSSRQGKYGPFSGPVTIRERNFSANIINGSGKKVETFSGDSLTVLNGEGRAVSLDKVANPTVSSVSTILPLPGAKGLNLVSLSCSANSRRYRGSLEIRLEDGKLTAVNELNIEDYLRGVVPAEMPPAWPAEALKAQAVAARNFALQRVQTTRGMSYNVSNDQSSQVYKGYDCETQATNLAVEETRGMVMLSSGSLITAFFHSSSGGYTENCEDVWNIPVPYIKSKADPYDKNDRHYDWQVSYTGAQLAEKLSAAGYGFNKVTDIEEIDCTSSGLRVEKIAVIGEDLEDRPLRVEIFNADKVRIALGLKSALFKMDKKYDKNQVLTTVNIVGSGWGHGLGMSQWGAYGMSGQGYNYQDILKYYYSGINISANYGR